jgi:predicted nucleic acid-binding Zn ribbon protein
MPLYEYAPILNEGENSRPCCTFETLQNHTDAPLTQCPSCGHIVVRLISDFGIGTNSASQHQNSIEIALPESKAADGSSQSLPTKETASKLPTSNTAAGRVLGLTAGHVCHAGCKH